MSVESGTVRVPSSILERMIEHARSILPEECCGVLGGEGTLVSSIYPLTNTLHSPTRYLADPRELFDAVRSMRDKGEEMIGIYHSHPGASLEPSSRDREENGYPGLFYFIVSVRAEDPRIRCFVMSEEGVFTPVRIAREEL